MLYENIIMSRMVKTMEVRIEKKDKKCILHVSGRIDTVTSPDLEEKIKQLENEKFDEMEMDFSDVEYVSSSGLRIILTETKKSIKEGYSFILTNPRDNVMEILEMTGFNEIMTIKKGVNYGKVGSYC